MQEDFLNWAMRYGFEHDDPDALCTWRSSHDYRCLRFERAADQWAAPNIDHFRDEDDYGGSDDIACLINYGSQPGDWCPNGTACINDNLDKDYLGLPDLTAFCTLCRCISRDGERGLSHVEKCPDGTLMRVCDKPCWHCNEKLNQL